MSTRGPQHDEKPPPFGLVFAAALLGVLSCWGLVAFIFVLARFFF
ncbi:MAG: hypothetical protein WDA25_01120 [Paracoccaceae bacterium]